MKGRASIAKYTFTDTQILDTEIGWEVMSDWEDPIMVKHAEVVTRNGGDILESGFGMGISATHIQSFVNAPIVVFKVVKLMLILLPAVILEFACGAPPKAQFIIPVVAVEPLDSNEPLIDIIPELFNPAPLIGIIHLPVVSQYLLLILLFVLVVLEQLLSILMLSYHNQWTYNFHHYLIL